MAHFTRDVLSANARVQHARARAHYTALILMLYAVKKSTPDCRLVLKRISESDPKNVVSLVIQNFR